MPFRFVEEEEVQEDVPTQGKFRFVEEEKEEPLPIGLRIPVKMASELFGGAVGGIPQLAETARQMQPIIEEREEAARPSYLTGAGLEPAPERGLLNLMALLGQTSFVQKMLPASLRERFKETTGERFEPQTAVERVLSRATGKAGEGLPFGLPLGVGFAGGLSGALAEEAGVGEPGQALAELLGTLGGGALRAARKAPKVVETKPSGLPVRKFEKLKKPTKVFKGTAEKALQETEKDFRQLTSDLQTKTNRSYKAMVEDPSFKATVSDLFENVEKGAADLKDPVSAKNLARELHTQMRKTREKGITRSPTEITKRNELNKFFQDTADKKVTAKQLLEQYRKNNEQLSKLYPYGENALENIGKREALESYNRAIANTIEEKFPKTEFADLFKFTNKRWSEIKKIETVDKYLNALFKGDKINFRQAEKAVTEPKYAGRLKNALGKEGFAEFKQINKDLLSKEKTLKLLNAKGFTLEDLPKKALYFLVKPKLTTSLIGKDLALKIWRQTISNPKYLREWRKGLSLFKRGLVKQGIATLRSLDRSIQSDQNKASKQK